MTTPSEPEAFPQVPPPPPALPAWQAEPDEDDALGGQLHPAAIGVWSAGQLGALAFVALLNPAFVPFALPVLLVTVVLGAVRYSRFRWRVSGGTLVIEQGLLQRSRRVIPLERIQSVDLVRRVSHRLFGVVAVHVEAVGGRETEGQLDALSPALADRLRTTLLAGRGAAAVQAQPDAAGRLAGPEAAGQPAGAPLVALRPRQLLVAGLTEANGTVLVAVAGLIWQVVGERLDEEALLRVPDLLAGNVVVIAVVLGLLAAVVLLVAAQFLLYWDFELRSVEGALQVRRGLLEQRFDTIPLRRVQALRIEENLPRRLLGFASVRADVAGKPGGGSGGTDTLLPFGTRAEADALIARLLDEPALGGDGGAAAVGAALRPMPRRARTRRWVRAAALTLVVGTGGLLVWGPPGALALLVAVPAVAAAEASYRALGHLEQDALAVARAGWWVRRTAYVPTSRLQSLALRCSIVQRWRRLATVELQVARPPGLWSGPRIIDVDRDVAGEVVGRLAPLAAGVAARGALGGRPQGG